MTQGSQISLCCGHRGGGWGGPMCQECQGSEYFKGQWTLSVTSCVTGDLVFPLNFSFIPQMGTHIPDYPSRRGPLGMEKANPLERLIEKGSQWPLASQLRMWVLPDAP